MKSERTLLKPFRCLICTLRIIASNLSENVLSVLMDTVVRLSRNYLIFKRESGANNFFVAITLICLLWIWPLFSQLVAADASRPLLCVPITCPTESEDFAKYVAKIWLRGDTNATFLCTSCDHCWNLSYSYCSFMIKDSVHRCVCDLHTMERCTLVDQTVDKPDFLNFHTCNMPQDLLPLPPLKVVQSNSDNFTISVPNIQQLDYWKQLNYSDIILRVFCPEAVCSEFDDVDNDTFLISQMSFYNVNESTPKLSGEISLEKRQILRWSDFLKGDYKQSSDIAISMDYVVYYKQCHFETKKDQQDLIEEQCVSLHNHSEPILLRMASVQPSAYRSINTGLIVLIVILTLLLLGMILACIARRHTVKNLSSKKKLVKQAPNKKTQKRDDRVVYKTKFDDRYIDEEEEWKLLPTMMNSDKSETNSPAKTHFYKNDIAPKYGDVSRNATIIPLSHLDLLEIIGQGQFGPIKRGYVGQKNECMVHCAKTPYKSNPDESKVLLEQLESSIKASSHPNIISFVGIAEQGEDMYVAMQLETGPHLRNLLRESRSLENFLQYAQSHGRISLMSSQRLLSIMLGIARGMCYLEENKVLHDNLAAVNVVIGENGTPKISGFGMATLCDLFMRQAEKNHKKLRWLPPETLTEHLFSLKSQIWSFGVVLWEIVTLGGSPYYDLNDVEVMNKVPMGLRLDKPLNCSFKLYDLMVHCWTKEAESRLNFVEILRTLQDLNLNPDEHIDLTVSPNFEYESFFKP